MSVFEIIMLLCFGVASPANLYKSITSKTNAGKSLIFLIAVWIGYINGILHKYIYNRDPVMRLYVINATVVSIDIVFYGINHFRDKRNTSSIEMV